MFPSRRKILFVHGCFWHRHNCPDGCVQPKSNIGFWMPKLQANALRDRRTITRLRGMGWSVAVVWECKIRKGAWIARTVRFLETTKVMR